MPQSSAFRFSSLALAAVLASSVAASTVRPQDSSKSSTDAISVDVRVSDKDGKPVTDLTSDDFVVTFDGQAKAAAIQSFAVAKPSTGRTLVFVLDDLSTDTAQLKALVGGVPQMLSALDAADLAGVATTSGLGPMVAPTRDRAAVTAALASPDLVGRAGERTLKPFVGFSEAFEMVRTGGNKDVGGKVVERECSAGGARGGGRGGGGGGGGSAKPDDVCVGLAVATARNLATVGEQRTARQIAALAKLMTSLSSASEPHALVVLSGGVALPVGPSDAADILGRRAAETNTAVYGLVWIDESDLVTEVSADRSKARREDGTVLTTGLETLAQATGGEAFRMSSATEPASFGRMVSDVSATYRLTVEPPSGPKKRDLAVKITTKRAGLTAHAASRAVRASVTDAPVPAADALKQRVEQGGTGFGVPLALTTSRRKDAGTKVQLVASIDVPAATPGPVTAMFALINSNGSVVQSGKKEIPAAPGDDYRLALPLPADPGDYRFRVAVADGQGHIGSLDDVVSVKLPKLGPVAVSDLLTMSANADAPPHLLAFQTLPPRAQTLRVSMELYPEGPNGSALKVQLSVAPAGGGAPLVSGEVPPVPRDDRLLVSAALPVAALKPGQYVITATVLDSGKPVGSATALVTKIQ
jgi:VWFA-related protein